MVVVVDVKGSFVLTILSAWRKNLILFWKHMMLILLSSLQFKNFKALNWIIVFFFLYLGWFTLHWNHMSLWIRFTVKSKKNDGEETSERFLILNTVTYFSLMFFIVTIDVTMFNKKLQLILLKIFFFLLIRREYFLSLSKKYNLQKKCKKPCFETWLPTIWLINNRLGVRSFWLCE
jgi:hypothetical protein